MASLDKVAMKVVVIIAVMSIGFVILAILKGLDVVSSDANATAAITTGQVALGVGVSLLSLIVLIKFIAPVLKDLFGFGGGKRR